MKRVLKVIAALVLFSGNIYSMCDDFMASCARREGLFNDKELMGSGSTTGRGRDAQGLLSQKEYAFFKKAYKGMKSDEAKKFAQQVGLVYIPRAALKGCKPKIGTEAFKQEALKQCQSGALGAKDHLKDNLVLYNSNEIKDAHVAATFDLKDKRLDELSGDDAKLLGQIRGLDKKKIATATKTFSVGMESHKPYPASSGDTRDIMAMEWLYLEDKALLFRMCLLADALGIKYDDISNIFKTNDGKALLEIAKQGTTLTSGKHTVRPTTMTERVTNAAVSTVALLLYFGTGLFILDMGTSGGALIGNFWPDETSKEHNELAELKLLTPRKYFSAVREATKGLMQMTKEDLKKATGKGSAK